MASEKVDLHITSSVGASVITRRLVGGMKVLDPIMHFRNGPSPGLEA